VTSYSLTISTGLAVSEAFGASAFGVSFGVSF